MLTEQSKRAMRFLLVVASALGLVGAMSPASAGAQTDDCYPDGCTPPTNPPVVDVECELSAEAGVPGDTVVASVTNVSDGGVRLAFGGSEVARSAEGGSEVDLEFEVPDVAPGSYPVVAVGATFTAECAVFDTRAETRVEGGVSNRGDVEESGVLSSGGSLSDRESGSGPLPFTGSQTAVLVAVAVGLVLAGSRLLMASKRRRRTAHP